LPNIKHRPPVPDHTPPAAAVPLESVALATSIGTPTLEWDERVREQRQPGAWQGLSGAELQDHIVPFDEELHIALVWGGA
jgi:hypothetical protein